MTGIPLRSVVGIYRRSRSGGRRTGPEQLSSPSCFTTAQRVQRAQRRRTRIAFSFSESTLAGPKIGPSERAIGISGGSSTQQVGRRTIAGNNLENAGTRIGCVRRSMRRFLWTIRHRAPSCYAGGHRGCASNIMPMAGEGAHPGDDLGAPRPSAPTPASGGGQVGWRPSSDRSAGPGYFDCAVGSLPVHGRWPSPAVPMSRPQPEVRHLATAPTPGPVCGSRAPGSYTDHLPAASPPPSVPHRGGARRMRFASDGEPLRAAIC